MLLVSVIADFWNLRQERPLLELASGTSVIASLL